MNLQDMKDVGRLYCNFSSCKIDGLTDYQLALQVQALEFVLGYLQNREDSMLVCTALSQDLYHFRNMQNARNRH